MNNEALAHTDGKDPQRDETGNLFYKDLKAELDLILTQLEGHSRLRSLESNRKLRSLAVQVVFATFVLANALVALVVCWLIHWDQSVAIRLLELELACPETRVANIELQPIINSQVVIALIGGTVAQVGAAAFFVTRRLFADRPESVRIRRKSTIS